MRGAYAAMLIVAVAASLQAAHYHPRLPDRLVASFGPAMEPAGTTGKGAFFGVYFLVLTLVAVSIILVILLLDRLPDRYINIPHREHWLAAERKGEALSYLKRGLAWFTVVTMVFVVTIFQVVISWNLEEGPRNLASASWLLIGFYMLATAAWMIRTILHFSAAHR